jgi:uncharacterized membrane protein (UPF0127 family)
MVPGPARIVLRGHGVSVCERCVIAQRPLARAKGLLGRKQELAAGEGLLLKPAPSIHTWFMRFPIDAVFLDRNMSVIAIEEDLRPWRTAGRRGARAVLELRSGESRRRGIKRGDRLSVEPILTDVPVVFVRTPAASEEFS